MAKRFTAAAVLAATLTGMVGGEGATAQVAPYSTRLLFDAPADQPWSYVVSPDGAKVLALSLIRQFVTIDTATGAQTAGSVELPSFPYGGVDNAGRFALFNDFRLDLVTGSQAALPALPPTYAEREAVDLSGNAQLALIESRDEASLALDTFAYDFATGSLRTLGEGVPDRPGAGIDRTIARSTVSSDGRVAAFVYRDSPTGCTKGPECHELWLEDLGTGSVTGISVTPSGALSATGVNLNPTISANGRFVTFVSTAIDLVPGPRDARRRLSM